MKAAILGLLLLAGCGGADPGTSKRLERVVGGYRVIGATNLETVPGEYMVQGMTAGEVRHHFGSLVISVEELEPGVVSVKLATDDDWRSLQRGLAYPILPKFVYR